jgi:HEPN domain-containing protein
MKAETREWIRVAEPDSKAARSLLEDGLCQGCVFFCQQSIEKLLKAIWIERHGADTHPRTHNLVRLASELRLVVSPEHEALLQELTDQVFASRYPEAGWEYNEDVARDFRDRTEELFQWLQQQLM